MKSLLLLLGLVAVAVSANADQSSMLCKSERVFIYQVNFQLPSLENLLIKDVTSTELTIDGKLYQCKKSFDLRTRSSELYEVVLECEAEVKEGTDADLFTVFLHANSNKVLPKPTEAYGFCVFGKTDVTTKRLSSKVLNFTCAKPRIEAPI